MNGAAAEEESEGPSALDRLGTVTDRTTQNPLFRGVVHGWNAYSSWSNSRYAAMWFAAWVQKELATAVGPLRAWNAARLAAADELFRTPYRPWRDVPHAIRAGQEAAADQRRITAQRVGSSDLAVSRAKRGLGLVRGAGRALLPLAVIADTHTLVTGSQYEGTRGQVDRAMAGVGLASVGLLAVGVAAAPVLVPVAVVAGVGAAAWGVGNFVADAVDWGRAHNTVAAAGTRVATGARNVVANTSTVVANAGSAAASGIRSVGRRFGFGG